MCQYVPIMLLSSDKIVVAYAAYMICLKIFEPVRKVDVICTAPTLNFEVWAQMALHGIYDMS
jgi:hypothetical protein